MIYQDFNDLLTDTEYTGLYQTVSLLFFMLFFIVIVLLVVRKPQNYYKDVSESPIDSK
ncbi:CcoQ/FixQ family Cbb3-type cytochrome c oxidase assembly chaperone [Chryseobacterium viscerum]|uniref:CcoQ/FixQ family Cbb3-type cytochrome c oxidase assembly chaperone n=1 Tax=Chryseobacterium viscerum TaxID=1037377 RepID=A0A316WC73_9FLAO|nr:CcoQ/FixQ family Cbb3-type cytochrome c oxidase assembly chaperone [Chryseobacterium viscerum]